MSATIAAKMVVSFHYKLHDNAGELLDSSDEGQPMPYLHGASNIVPGLEKAMSDKKVGDKFEVKVAPADGYGERVEGSTTVPRSGFPADAELQAGMNVMAESPDGEVFPLWIVKVTDEEVTVDPNHPLAGTELNFAVEVAAIRAATEEELEHGHVHGAGCDHD